MFGPRRSQNGPPGLSEVCALLDELELRYLADEEHSAILLGFEGDNAEYDIYILVSQEKAIVYIAIAHYLDVPPTHERLGEIMRRLMELNWEFSLGKLEWDSQDGEVRLSHTITTEDGLGRDALGVVIGYLVAAADRHYNELTSLVA